MGDAQVFGALTRVTPRISPVAPTVSTAFVEAAVFEEGDCDEPTAVSDEYGIGARQGEYVPRCVPSVKQSNKTFGSLPAWRREAGRQKASISTRFYLLRGAWHNPSTAKNRFILCARILK